MKNIKYIISALSLLIAFGLQAQQQMPDVSIKTLEGKPINITEYAKNGKVTVVSFWATWCSPCKRELDAIADYYEDWQADYDMELVAVTIDNVRALSKVKPMVESKGWEYIILSDVKSALPQALNFNDIPHTFILDKAGNIAYRHSGYTPGDEDELEAKIKELSAK